MDILFVSPPQKEKVFCHPFQFILLKENNFESFWLESQTLVSAMVQAQPTRKWKVKHILTTLNISSIFYRLNIPQLIQNLFKVDSKKTD
jgi:hypothetical protein